MIGGISGVNTGHLVKWLFRWNGFKLLKLVKLGIYCTKWKVPRFSHCWTLLNKIWHYIHRLKYINKIPTNYKNKHLHFVSPKLKYQSTNKIVLWKFYCTNQHEIIFIWNLFYNSKQYKIYELLSQLKSRTISLLYSKYWCLFALNLTSLGEALGGTAGGVERPEVEMR